MRMGLRFGRQGGVPEYLQIDKAVTQPAERCPEQQRQQPQSSQLQSPGHDLKK